MLGLLFESCNEFGLSFQFENCTLNHASFYGTKIRKTKFKSTQLHEVDFTTSDLSYAVFDDCDLSGSTFEKTILEHADFRTAIHYSIDPEINYITKAKFSIFGIPGLLEKYDIVIDITN